MKAPFCRALALLLVVCMVSALLPVVQAATPEDIRVIWDMETLPDNLIAEQLAVALYPDSGDYIPGNVTVKGVSGKGRNGSRALAVAQVGACVWADIFTLYPERDYGASYDLLDAQLLWVWTDASAFSREISMDFRPDGRYPFIGDRYFTCAAGQTTATVRTIPDAWNGIQGRITVPAGFVGWLGVPFSSLVTFPETLQSLYFYMSVHDLDAGKGKTVYFDDFTLSSMHSAPDGIVVPSLSYADTAKAPKMLWDMEALPADLLRSGLSVASGAVKYNVRVQGADAAGFRGSRALQLLQYGPYSETDTVTLNCSRAEGFDGNWRGGDMLMFWADASEFTGTKVRLSLTVGNKPLTVGACWYRERNGLLVKSDTCEAAYDGADYGAVTLPANFCGWVGIPLSAFKGGVHQVSSLRLHISYSDDLVQRNSLYLDELRLICGNRMPADTVTGAGSRDSGIVLNAAAKSDLNSYLTVEPDTVYQTMTAYGASDCWWTSVIGLRSNVTDALALAWGKDGIGLNNYRLNIGGSVAYTRSDGPIGAGRAALSPFNEEGHLDITRNAGSWNTYSALLDMVEQGNARIDDLTLFMNTPPSCFTEEGITWGGVLKPDCYEDYARYTADVVSAYEAVGLPVKYVSPINEPLSGFWTGNIGQEGMDYQSAAELAAVAEQCIRAVEANGLDTKVSVFEFNTWRKASTYLDTLLSNETIANHIDHISAHSYGLEGQSRREQIAEQIQQYGLATHMTEWAMQQPSNADNMDTALELAETVYADLAFTGVDTWSWWIAVGGGGYSDALMYYSAEQNVIETTKRLWALGQFSLFTTGATRIGTKDGHLPDGVRAMAFTKDNTLIYTLSNENEAAVALHLVGLPSGADGLLYATTEDYNCELLGHINADRAVTLPSRSVVTVVFEGIALSSVSSTATPAEAAAVMLLDMEACNAEQGFSTHRPTLVSASIADGKGEGSSRAIALSYQSWDADLYWDAAFHLSPVGLGGSSNWDTGDTLWFRADASEFPDGLYLQLGLNDGANHQMPIGTSFLLWDGKAAPTVCSAEKTWDGATYGRMWLPAGFIGYIGVPMHCYEGLNRTNIQQLGFYFEPSEPCIPCALYLDEFWLTEENSTPALTPSIPSAVCKDIFDMECLQSKQGNPPAAVVGDSHGLDGSTALGYRCFDGAALQLNTADFNGFDRNWTNADRFWFWTDTRAFSAPVSLCVQLNQSAFAATSLVTLWNRHAPVQQISCSVTDDNTVCIVLPEGYFGFVGLPLNGYTVGGKPNLADVQTVTFRLDCSGVTSSDVLWLDELWITAEDVLPKVPNCSHSHTSSLAGIPATCTEAGLTQGLECTDCGALLVAQEVIAPLGHAYTDGICTRCDEEDPDYIPPDPCEGYSDIDRSAWYHFAADHVIKHGYMGSTKTDRLTFEPNTKVSRAMVAMILYRLAGSPEAAYKASFTDVKAGQWYTVAIEWCAQNGLAAGKGNGTFDPNGNVTRQELAVFMCSLAKHLGQDTSRLVSLGGFTDTAAISGWARTHVQWAVGAGLLSGKKQSDGSLRLAPTDNATRAEFAAVITRFTN